MEEVRLQIEGRIGILTIENPPVNALRVTIQESLRAAMAEAMNESSIDAVVLIGAGKTFVAGADIRELKRVAIGEAEPSNLPDLLTEIESARKPVIAAIQGMALGGGLELALAAHYRIAGRDAKVGQPEVKLGIIPGAGGTQRLLRLAGVETALEMCVFGEPISAEVAQQSGIIDQIADADLFEAAIRFATDVIRIGPRRTRDLTDKIGTRESNTALFTVYRERARKTRRNQNAPAAAIDAIEAATELSFEE